MLQKNAARTEAIADEVAVYARTVIQARGNP